jgi:hypothetical protein
MKNLFTLSALVAATVLSAGLAVSVKAESNANTSLFDMKTVSCKELMLAGSDDRDLMMSLFHGFMNGRKNETQLDPNQLSKVTDEIQNYCVNNPNTNLLEVFEKYRGNKP